MYEFVDTIEEAGLPGLPAEAMSINGVYLENEVPGYRTLHVSGREAMSQELMSTTAGMRDGEIYQGRHLPSREITVTYQIVASTPEDYRDAYNLLNGYLREAEQAQLIFADEPDKFFVGTFKEAGEVEPGRNAVVGTLTFFCADPCKYSVEEYEAELQTGEDGDYFVVDYGGTYPAFPVLGVEFYQSEDTDNNDGNCGFVAFINDKGKVLQFGNPEEPDATAEKVAELIATADQRPSSTQIITEAFNATGSWAVNAGYTTVDTYVQSGTLKCAVFPTTAAYDKAIQANSYGSDSAVQYHGPSACRTIPAPKQKGTTGTRSADFSWTWAARFCASNVTATAKAQQGCLQGFLLDANSRPLCGVQLWKAKGATTGVIRVYVRGHSYVKEWTGVDFSYYNEFFGYQKGTTGKKPNLGVTITKSGGKF